MCSKIISAATAVPKYKYSIEEILIYVKRWSKDQPDNYRKKIIKIFEGAQIRQKFSIVPIDKIFSPLSFEDKNNYYIEAAIDLGSKVLQEAMDKACVKSDNIDFLVTTSCTGYMIPSLDAFLIDRLGLRHDIHRLPVTEMGCAGGSSALIYVDHFLKANPEKTAAIVSVELPSITFQYNDFSMDNIVGSAIFADGAACVIFGNTDKIAPEIIDTQMNHFNNTTHILGFNLTNGGFKIILGEQIPDVITENLEGIIYPFLKRNDVDLTDIDNFIFHPGGKKITANIENLLEKFGKEINKSKEIMRNYGNMSSSTILFILEDFLHDNINTNDYGLVLGFGPGFTAQLILLKWH